MAVRLWTRGPLRRPPAGGLETIMTEEITAIDLFEQESIDQEALAQLARVFDRPAFYTPIHQESSLPAFKQAITDSIKAIGTGIWQTRDGRELARLRPRHEFTDDAIRQGLADTEKALAELRAKFDGFVRAGSVRSCGCDVPDCPVFMVEPQAARELEELRHKALQTFKRVHPEFEIARGW